MPATSGRGCCSSKKNKHKHRDRHPARTQDRLLFVAVVVVSSNIFKIHSRLWSYTNISNAMDFGQPAHRCSHAGGGRRRSFQNPRVKSTEAERSRGTHVRPPSHRHTHPRKSPLSSSCVMCNSYPPFFQPWARARKEASESPECIFSQSTK